MRPKALQRGTHYRSAGYADTLGRIASNVRRLREARGWTQEEVAARAADLSPRLYRQIEGVRGNVTAATLTRLAEAFGVDVAELLVPAAAPAPRPRGRPSKGLGAQATPVEVPPPSAPAEGSASTAAEPHGGDPWARLRSLSEALRAEVERLGATVASPPVSLLVGPSGEGGPRKEIPIALLSSMAPGASLRDVLAALLAINPTGLLTVEMAEAVAALGRRPRKNEIHALVSALYQAGRLTREGRRGSFRYHLRGDREPTQP